VRRSTVLALVLFASTMAAVSPARAGGKAVDGAVNLNTAPPDVLALLPGIGPAKAQSILVYRKRHPFRTVDELVRIKGVGRKMVRRLRAHLAVSGPTTAAPIAASATPATLPPPPPKRPLAPLACVHIMHVVPRAPRPATAHAFPSHGVCPRAP
jgi:competence ComEA-like helix-hairpin-helix protein